MKTTTRMPNWFTICCHQLTFRLRLQSVLQTACLPSLGGLLFKPAKHIKLTLALPISLALSFCLLVFLLVFRCNSCGSMCKFNQSAYLRMLQCSLSLRVLWLASPKVHTHIHTTFPFGNLIKCIGFLLD